MSRTTLERAASTLEEAANAASDDETKQRLESQSSQFESLADANRGPDHGKLARHEHVLTEIADEEGGAVANLIAEALESIHAYRETLEGV
ncbi:DUF7553 family protein [Natronorubrum daqingense]|uniref:Uncharacterized protein n=1 Tax=Natronorubrum daqingense TaxID=588898 RepID=A0A1N7FTH6_9EURY|nr:hypothetical protein [Natronorubrum daqingense]APX97410.1 hypothetical protein BB347_12755 [Natronorubrum daqingense]SIS03584.1 hypothetical protein SAMN05421809_3490 [Natronorubrum daqingense]